MQHSPRVAAVILAAGASTRFGSSKQLAEIGGQRMIEVVVGAAQAAGLRPVLAVLPPEVAAPIGTIAVRNDDPRAGLSRSLHLGLAAVPDDVDAAVVLLGDQPTVEPTMLAALLNEMGGERPVVAVSAEGRIGPPVLLHREAFALADQATGDSGLGPILARYPEMVATLELGAHPVDVDTPSDLARIVHMFDSDR